MKIGLVYWCLLLVGITPDRPLIVELGTGIITRVPEILLIYLSTLYRLCSLSSLFYHPSALLFRQAKLCSWVEFLWCFYYLDKLASSVWTSCLDPPLLWAWIYSHLMRHFLLSLRPSFCVTINLTLYHFFQQAPSLSSLI